MTGRAAYLATARRPDRVSGPLPTCGRSQRATTGVEDAMLIGRLRMERKHSPTPQSTMGGRPFHSRNRPTSGGQQERHCWKVSPVGPDRAAVADQGSGAGQWLARPASTMPHPGRAAGESGLRAQRSANSPRARSTAKADPSARRAGRSNAAAASRGAAGQPPVLLADRRAGQVRLPLLQRDERRR